MPKESRPLKVSTLAPVLGVGKGDVVALVGAGGKTTAMLLLARELTSRGLTVVVTTTTHIWPPSCYPMVLKEDLGEVKAALSGGAAAVVASGWDGGKLKGISPEFVGALRDVADVVLVEADGSAGRPLKAPREYEPVIPPCTTLVVAVAGMEAVGKPLGTKWTHRPERVAEITGLKPGEAITPQAVARVLLHPQGVARGAPPGARIAVLLNQADSEEAAAQAREVALHLVKGGAGRVVVASLMAEPPCVRAFQEGEEA